MQEHATCKGAMYDPCLEEHDCQIALCRPFNNGEIIACTKACTPGDNSTCDLQNGKEVTCNADGLCQPEAVNECVLAVLQPDAE